MFLITFSDDQSTVTTVCQRADNLIEASSKLLASRPWILPDMLLSVERLDSNSVVDRQAMARLLASR